MKYEIFIRNTQFCAQLYIVLFSIDDVQFKGKCLLKKMKLAKENKNPRVALTFYGETYRIRTIFHDQDLEERVLSFYDNMDTFYTNRDMGFPDNDKLECAVNRVLALIEQLVHSPNSSQGSPKRRVSPCTAEQSNEIPDFELGTQDEHSPGVRAIEHDFGSTNSVDSIAEKKNDPWQPVIVQESSSNNNNNNNKRNVDYKHERKRSSTHGSNKKKSKSKKKNVDKTNDERHEDSSGLPLVIDKHREWKHIFALLTRNGWKWRNGGIAYDKILIKPGHDFKEGKNGVDFFPTGKIGVDFFPTDLWGHGDEIKDYMHKNYGWVGPQASSDESESDVTKDQNHNENVSCDESYDDQLVDDNSEHDDEDDTFEYVEEDDTNSHDNTSWSQCWKQMQTAGWTMVPDRKKERMYLRPGIKSISGVYGKDFFNLSDVQEYARGNFGWKGGDKADTDAHLSSENSVEKSLKGRSSKGRRTMKKNKKKKVKSGDAESKANSNPKKRTKIQAKGTNSKRQKKGKGSMVYENEVTWRRLKNEYGWTCKPAGKYCNLHDWYYIRPGVTPSSKSAKIGEHYFLTERDAVNYASEHMKILSNSVSDNQSSVPPSATNTQSNRDETYSGDGSDEEKGKGSMVYENEVTWRRLKNEYGWTCKPAGKYCNLHDWYYIRPGVTPSSKSAKIGEHYFLTERDAVNYASEHMKILSNSESNFSDNQSSVPPSAPNTQSNRDETYSGDGSDEETFEPFTLKDFDDSWWHYEKIPKFYHVWPTIRDKLNVKHNGDSYLLPDGTRCNSVEEMQLYFCQNGLPPTPPGVSLNDNELKLLTRFASLAHMPKRVGNFRLSQNNCIAILSGLPGGSSFDDDNAWKVLKEIFGARFENNSYFVDCIPNGEKNYTSIKHIRQSIRSHGITLPSWAEPESVKHQVALLLWSSVLPIPVQENNEKLDSSKTAEENVETEDMDTDKQSGGKTGNVCNQEVSKAARCSDKDNNNCDDSLYKPKTKKRNLELIDATKEINNNNFSISQDGSGTNKADAVVQSVEFKAKSCNSERSQNFDSDSFTKLKAFEDNSEKNDCSMQVERKVQADEDAKFDDDEDENMLSDRTDSAPLPATNGDGELNAKGCTNRQPCHETDEQIFDDDVDDNHCDEDEFNNDYHAPLTQEHPRDDNLNCSFAYEDYKSPRKNMEDDAQSIDISTLWDNSNMDINTSPQHVPYHSTQLNDFLNSYHPPHDESYDDETHSNPRKVLFREDLN
jgi:hypothetical protein